MFVFEGKKKFCFYKTYRHNGISFIKSSYSTLFRFWPVGDWAKLAVGPIGCGEVARGGCVFTWNFRVTRSTTDYFRWSHHHPFRGPEELSKMDIQEVNCTSWGGQKTKGRTWRCIGYSLIAYSLRIPPAKNRALHCTFQLTAGDLSFGGR